MASIPSREFLKSVVSPSNTSLQPSIIKEIISTHSNLSSYFMLTRRRPPNSFTNFEELRLTIERASKSRLKKPQVFSLHLINSNFFILKYSCFHENFSKPSFESFSDFKEIKIQDSIISTSQSIKALLTEKFHELHRSFVHNNFNLQYRFYYDKNKKFIGTHLHPKFDLSRVQLFNKDEIQSQNINNTSTLSNINSFSPINKPSKGKEPEKNYFYLFEFKELMTNLNNSSLKCFDCKILKGKKEEMIARNILKRKEESTILINSSKKRVKIDKKIRGSLEKEIGTDLTRKIIDMEETNVAKEKVDKKRILNESKTIKENLKKKLKNGIIRLFGSLKKSCIEEKVILKVVRSECNNVNEKDFEDVFKSVLKENSQFLVLEHLNVRVIYYKK